MTTNNKTLLAGAIRKGAPYIATPEQRAKIDAQFNAVKQDVLTKQGFRCACCGYESKNHMELHHLDGDHANNDPSNLVAMEELCHATQHLGQDTPKDNEKLSSDGLRSVSILVAMPEITQQDLNLLQRALGAALADPTERENAKAIINTLKTRDDAVFNAYGHKDAKSFGAALPRLTQEQYDNRHKTMGGLRVLFHPKTMYEAGVKMLKEYQELAVSKWPQLFQEKLANKNN